MDKTKTTKSQKQIKHTNVLESLKDVTSSASQSVKKDLLSETSKDFIKELLGMKIEKKVSGEIMPGESIEVDDVLSGKSEEVLRYKKQAALEKRLRQEEQEQNLKKSNELRVQLHALQQEIIALSTSTQDLAEETKVAAMQAPIEPGVYHLVFFEKLLEFIQSFRKKVQEASVWLQSYNRRAEKKNYWAKYKKLGSKFFLSPDHYLTRSAG